MDKEFFLVPEEVFRMGNATSPRMSYVREQEVLIIPHSGVPMIVADNRGVSLYTDEELRKTNLTG